MVFERDRLAHHRVGISRRVLARRDGDPAEMARRVAAIVKEAPREHRDLVDRTDEAVGRVEGRLVALRLREVALARRARPRAAARSAVARAVDEDAAGHARCDGRRRVRDRLAPAAPAVADLAEETQVRDPEVARDHVLGRVLDRPLDHAVDLGRPEPRIVEGDARGLERGHVLGFADVLRERELADADDGGAILERHGSRLPDRATAPRAEPWDSAPSFPRGCRREAGLCGGRRKGRICVVWSGHRSDELDRGT